MDKTEIIHLVVSWITITLAFSIDSLYLGIQRFLVDFPILLLVLGAGFIFHELGHRTVARKFGLVAFYRAWIPGLLLALALAFMTAGRFVFAAPGAVYIGGRPISRRENGLISLAGPMVNLLLGLGFLGLAFSPVKTLALIGLYGAKTNFFLAAFNMIPFPPLDGYKVMLWNPIIWFISIAIPGGLLLFI